MRTLSSQNCQGRSAPSAGETSCVCTRIASARLYPETMTPFPEKMPFHGSDPTPPPVFVSFVCLVVLKLLFVPLRVHSWFLVFSVPLRGSSSTPSSVFVCFVCFVVLKILFVPLRVHSWFLGFFVCFVVLNFLFVPLRVHSWFLGFSVPLRGSVFFPCVSCVQSPLSPWP